MILDADFSSKEPQCNIEDILKAYGFRDTSDDLDFKFINPSYIYQSETLRVKIDIYKQANPVHMFFYPGVRMFRYIDLN